MLNILGINIHTLNKEKILKKIQSFLKASKSHYIITPNPEIILQAGNDEEFFYILNQADLAIPDGIGLKFASWFMGKNIQRITGSDLVDDILEIAQEKNLKAGIFNWQDSLSPKEEIKKTLKNKYPKLDFKIFELKKTTFCHPECNEVEPRDPLNKNKGIPQFPSDQVKMANHFDIALVALGAPYQEKFIYHNLINKNIKLSIGVGGSFDFLTNKIKRAPKSMRFFGLEWLWRLIKQPKRIKRIYNATIKFSFKFLIWRFILPQLYRPNVACMLYKKDKVNCEAREGPLGEKNNYKILLAERRDEKDHWQLPQGGTDGETLWQAGARELREEIDCDKFKAVAVFANLWKYKFGAQEKGYICDKNGKIQKHLGYKGQKQGLFIAEFVGKDSDININFWDHQDWKWVNMENFVDLTHECRQASAEIFLTKFQSIVDEELRIKN